jgi:hypothetical protein
MKKDHPIRKLAWQVVSKIPYTRQYRARKWVKDEYMAFAYKNMEYLFLSIARFAHINRPIDGYYMEFGSHDGRTMRLAWRHFR